MTIVAVLLPFVLLGIAVVFIAFSGGPGAAREAYLTRGGRVFPVAISGLFVGLGVVVPAVLVAHPREGQGGNGRLRTASISSKLEKGKQLFRNTCASCHTLSAVNARGVTGPDLDSLAPLDKQRVLNAIRRGGTGQGRMPSGLLQDGDADAVASYVSKVAGK